MLIFWRQSVTKKTKFHIWSHQRLIHNYRQYNCSLWGISYRRCRIFRQWKTVIKDVQKCFKLILKDGKHVESQRWQEGKGTAKRAKESDLVTKDCSVLLLLPGFYPQGLLWEWQERARVVHHPQGERPLPGRPPAACCSAWGILPGGAEPEEVVRPRGVTPWKHLAWGLLAYALPSTADSLKWFLSPSNM